EGEMNIAAVLIYDRALDETERQQVEGFLQTKYISDPNNTAPVAADDAFSVSEDGILNGDVLADNGNGVDNDPDGDPLSVNTTLVDDVDNGTLLLNSDGTFTYTPDPGFFGVDEFIYEVFDDLGETDQALVTITVDENTFVI
ncbi:MAG: Ig-like domain-containing protein, partial [Pseudomonadota bacterium]